MRVNKSIQHELSHLAAFRLAALLFSKNNPVVMEEFKVSNYTAILKESSIGFIRTDVPENLASFYGVPSAYSVPMALGGACGCVTKATILEAITGGSLKQLEEYGGLSDTDAYTFAKNNPNGIDRDAAIVMLATHSVAQKKGFIELVKTLDALNTINGGLLEVIAVADFSNAKTLLKHLNDAEAELDAIGYTRVA